MILLPQSTKHVDFYSSNGTRIFVVGDIHGCYDELFLALRAIDFDPSSDILFSLGDIVDRGTNDYRCMSLQLEPWFRQILGNHEALHLHNFLEHPGNGTHWAVHPDQSNDPEYRSFLDRCSNLPHAAVIDDRFVLVHAALPMISYSGLAEVVDIKQTLLEYEFYTSLYRPDPTLWDIHYLQSPYSATLPGIDYVFHGHYILPQVTTKGKSVYLDTGFMSPAFSKSSTNKLSFALLGDVPTYYTVSVDFGRQVVVSVEVNNVHHIPPSPY